MSRFWRARAQRSEAEQAVLDARFMADALSLGRRGLGHAWPNPSVGAVVVREGAGGPVIVGRGFTARGGRPHGEALAFDRAGLAAVDGTLYVSLEPCAHRSVRGATPCVERTMLSGVRRVVSAMADPNPEISGLGHALLRSAGIAVVEGIGGPEAARDHRGHVLRLCQRRPMVTLKLAQTRDGLAASLPGQPRLMITGEAANAQVHLMRAAHDAILVGIGTVLADDPALDVRLPGMAGDAPIPAVLDSRLSLPIAARLVLAARERPLWVIAGEHAPLAAEQALVAAGVEVMRVGVGGDGRVDPRAALHLLALRGITRVFCEGGPQLAEALADADLVDDLVVLTGSGETGAPGVPAFGPALSAAVEPAAGRFRLLDSRSVGADHLALYERTR